VEPEGQRAAGPWTPGDEARLRAVVGDGHARGLWVRFYTLNGVEGDRDGWTPGYNFGSVEAAQVRWRAAIAAGVDFIATDQYDAFAETRRAAIGAAGPRPRGVLQ
jgi:glycerophosphoryl diester phosphodiesterase